ncbi:hypothetical protein E0H56_14565 [Rhizobium leguminosarum bv. viciae]|nr:hypothetical protein E0H44_31670 [Rhizobium leguminosarum bv. viciae]TBZ73306.1 hypothetical protein E0H61_28520 [Rhizobium leguminosarum bv. viciae]TBZ80463.1 hypothetical protein E0H53_30250 [Rhizobium leguminosarum bv. viciae]TBZ94145.1 hypothetical protein E0H56_14565 [Rhizobium leguminosarum bv. viciae]TCA07239.1 hypothetical protein E0H68_30120 [Rhizobium leguminosarum bv. viciae]
MGTSRIATATQDMKGLTAQFESVRRFDATCDSRTFVEAAGFESTRSEDRSEGGGPHWVKIAALDSCQLAFV